jgi:integrase/recombinase XerD
MIRMLTEQKPLAEFHILSAALVSACDSSAPQNQGFSSTSLSWPGAATMFDRLFQNARVLARQQTGPLAEERRCYLAHCAEQQMSPARLQHIARYILVITEALRLAERPDELITRTEIEAEAHRRIRERPKRRMLTFRFTGQAVRWLTFLGRLQVPAPVPSVYAEHVGEFADYQVQERGLSAKTVAYDRRTIHEFLAPIEKTELPLKNLTVAQVDELLAKKVRDEGYARTTIQRWASALRRFFRFAERRGWCRQGLAAAIMAPRTFTHEGLPIGPVWDDVKRLLAATEGDRPVDIRDRALLMLGGLWPPCWGSRGTVPERLRLGA